MLRYDYFKELEGSYNRKFDNEEDKRLFNLIMDKGIKINILDHRYERENRYVKSKYHVAITYNFKTLVIDFMCPDDLIINDLMYDLVSNYSYIKDNITREDKLRLLINDMGYTDAQEIIDVLDVFEYIEKFMRESEIDLTEFIQYFDEI